MSQLALRHATRLRAGWLRRAVQPFGAEAPKRFRWTDLRPWDSPWSHLTRRNSPRACRARGRKPTTSSSPGPDRAPQPTSTQPCKEQRLVRVNSSSAPQRLHSSHTHRVRSEIGCGRAVARDQGGPRRRWSVGGRACDKRAGVSGALGATTFSPKAANPSTGGVCAPSRRATARPRATACPHLTSPPRRRHSTAASVQTRRDQTFLNVSAQDHRHQRNT